MGLAPVELYDGDGARFDGLVKAKCLKGMSLAGTETRGKNGLSGLHGRKMLQNAYLGTRSKDAILQHLCVRFRPDVGLIVEIRVPAPREMQVDLGVQTGGIVIKA